MEDETDHPEVADPAQAFEDLRAEVSGLRRADEYRLDLAADEPGFAHGGHDCTVARFDELGSPQKDFIEAGGE